MEEHGTKCAELDAIPARELRQRVEEAILSHIDPDQWERLQEIERIEKESIGKIPWNPQGSDLASGNGQGGVN